MFQAVSWEDNVVDKIHGFEAYTLKAADHKTQATLIPERGAWVSSLILPFKTQTREVLFQHDYAWDAQLNDLVGGIPFIFPVCARIGRNNQDGVYLYEGQQYHLKIHGFSWYMKWEVIQVEEDNIELCLRPNDETRERYPFEFEVRLHFKVLPGKLECHLTFKNSDSKMMPYYAGFHPYFLVKDKANTVLHFNTSKRLKYNEAMTDIIGEEPALSLPTPVNNPVINEQLSMLNGSREATLTFPNDEVLTLNITENAEYYNFIQLYNIPEKPFFCVEHWMSFPNAINTMSGVRWLKPQQEERATYCVSSDTFKSASH